MLNSDMLLDAMSGVRDEYVAQAQAALGYMGQGKRGRPRKLWRTVLMAAVIAALLAGAAYAANALFKMILTENDKQLSQDFNGAQAVYNDIGLILGFEGPEECHRVGFKAAYLPSEPTDQGLYPDGEWYAFLSDEDTEEQGFGGPIPYNIAVSAASAQTSFIIGGKTEIVKEYSDGELEIVEITADYKDTDFDGHGMDGASFIIVFDAANGYFLTISSNLYELEELEKILAGMELYVYMETYVPNDTLDYGFINPGRG